MGPNRKDTECEVCGGAVEPLSVGGGRVYLCQVCQR
jgi:formamidopyrimidine-DNA glycosylase